VSDLALPEPARALLAKLVSEEPSVRPSAAQVLELLERGC
jgi:hypothetical protein